MFSAVLQGQCFADCQHQDAAGAPCLVNVTRVAKVRRKRGEKADLLNADTVGSQTDSSDGSGEGANSTVESSGSEDESAEEQEADPAPSSSAAAAASRSPRSSPKSSAAPASSNSSAPPQKKASPKPVVRRRPEAEARAAQSLSFVAAACGLEPVWKPPAKLVPNNVIDRDIAYRWQEGWYCGTVTASCKVSRDGTCAATSRLTIT